ncbi:MAG: DUF4339 domain-containing protein [Verrucomicrobiales bacterium]|nr:DUF4339 domain-containing protein [Verrucomicrobiales bacterium]
MSQARYYYADDHNQPVGPFALADLEKMMVRQVLPPDTMVCPEGGMEWVTLVTLVRPEPAAGPAEPRLPLSAPPSRTPATQVSGKRKKKYRFVDTSLEGNFLRPLKMIPVVLLALVLAGLVLTILDAVYDFDSTKLRGNGSRSLGLGLTFLIYWLLQFGYRLWKKSTTPEE